MYATATINDFRANIRWHLDKALKNSKHDMEVVRTGLFSYASFGVQSECRYDERYDKHMIDYEGISKDDLIKRKIKRKRQVLESVDNLFDRAIMKFDEGISTALGELQRTVIKTKLDPQDLRQTTIQYLTDFKNSLESLAIPSEFRSIDDAEFKQRLRVFDERLWFRLRQFDVGFFIPSEPELPPNIGINIGTVTNSQIAVASPAATLSQNITTQAGAAITALEEACRQLGLPAKSLSELTSELAKMKVQLAKIEESSTTIKDAARSVKDIAVQEVAHSARNITEGAIGGMLTPSFTAALEALGRAIGAF